MAAAPDAQGNSLGSDTAPRDGEFKFEFTAADRSQSCWQQRACRAAAGPSAGAGLPSHGTDPRQGESGLKHAVHVASPLTNLPEHRHETLDYTACDGQDLLQPLLAEGFTARVKTPLPTRLLQPKPRRGAAARTPKVWNSKSAGHEKDEDNGDARVSSFRVFQLAKDDAGWLVVGCLVLLIRMPFSVSLPYFSSAIISDAISRDASRMHLMLVLFVAAGTIDAVLDFGCVFFFSYVKERIILRIRGDLFRSIVKQETAFFDECATGELVSVLTSDTQAIADDLTWVFRFSIEAVARIGCITGFMIYRDYRLGLLACGVIPLVALCNKVYGRYMHHYSKRVQETLAKANASAVESLANIRTVMCFGTQRYETFRFKQGLWHQYVLKIKSAVASGVYYMVVSTFLMNMSVQAILLAYGSYRVMHGMDKEILIATMLYQGQLQEWFSQLFNSFSNLVKSGGASAGVFRLLRRKPRVPEPGHHIPARIEGHVEFKDVVFAYPTRPQVQIFHGLSFTVPAGRTVALVGPSGAGKSTVFHLIENLYQPLAGSVSIDGHDVRSLDAEWLHNVVGLVPQEPVLFNCTIEENILYSRRNRATNMRNSTADGSGWEESLSDEELRRSRIWLWRRRTEVATEFAEVDEDTVNPMAVMAAKVANAHSFISELPSGYKTRVGERGLQLSGGQKQRVAIARAMLQNPRLLLLDEATSALDSESEALVQEALSKLMVDKTTLVIAHRLSTIADADRIIVFDGRGCMVEQGTHTDLMAKPIETDGVLPPTLSYRALVERQQSMC
mmetsp:Transcript_735/g.2773  ORF Transcript_735/g.2773 Transcript_735/m.2773 type:complete len:788 (-) Transcript_735:1134-3497(-)